MRAQGPVASTNVRPLRQFSTLYQNTQSKYTTLFFFSWKHLLICEPNVKQTKVIRFVSNRVNNGRHSFGGNEAIGAAPSFVRSVNRQWTEMDTADGRRFEFN